jgi:hypothetical protein
VRAIIGRQRKRIADFCSLALLLDERISFRTTVIPDVLMEFVNIEVFFAIIAAYLSDKM